MQHLIVLVLLILVVGLVFTITKWPGGLHMTFSQHAVATRWSKVFYSLIFITSLPLLMLFFAEWLVPNKDLPSAFLWFAGISALFQIACTWIPEEGGVKTVIHRTLTGLSGIAILPLVAIIALSTHLSSAVRIVAWLSLAMMIILLAIALKNQKGYRWAMLLQVGYYALFFVTVLVATYI